MRAADSATPALRSALGIDRVAHTHRRRVWRNAPTALLAGIVALVLLGWPSMARALRLALRARTDLRVQAAQEGGALVLRGELTDIRQRPVSGQPLSFALVAPDPAQPGRTARHDLTATTGSDGRFEVKVKLTDLQVAAIPGEPAVAQMRLVHIEARYAGTPQLGDASAETLVDLEKVDTTLELVLEPAQVATDSPQLDVQLRAAAGDMPWAAASIALAVDGKDLLVVRTAGDGRAFATLPIASLGTPGMHTLTARLDPGEQANGADVARRFALLAAVEVTLTLRPGGPGQRCAAGDWCVEGAVQAVAGGAKTPVPDAPVTLSAERRALGTLITDPAGRFAAVLHGTQIARLFPPGPVGLVARAHVPLPYHEIGLSQVAVLEVPPPPGLPGWLSGVPMLALAAAWFWRRWLARQRERALQAEAEATSAGLPSHAVRRVGEGGSVSCRLRGHLIHGETGWPAPGALTLHAEAPDARVLQFASEDGHFQVDPGPGRYVLRVVCAEHEPLEIALELPHDGTYDGCELLPASCRAVVRGSFAAAVRRWTGRAVDWSTETPREIEPRWSGAVRRGQGDVREAVRRVERALYGAKTESTDAAAARQAVARVDEVQR